MTFYKVLTADGKSQNGGTMQWSLPTQNENEWTPGDWHSIEGPPVVCRRGFHLTTEPGNWLQWDSVLWLAEGRGESDSDGKDKAAFQEARLLAPAPLPEYWQKAKAFVDTIPQIKFFQPDEKPDPDWKLSTAPSWDAARAATAAEARAAVRDAAWDAAWDAALYCLIECLCFDLDIAEEHRRYTREAWAIWQKGYGVLGQVDGVWYVYAQENAK